MKIDELVFPVTAEEFMAFQRELVGRGPTDGEREAIGAWIPIINAAYDDGLRKDESAIEADIDNIGCCVAKGNDDPVMSKFMKTVCRLIYYAWERGKKEAVEV